MQRAGGSRRRLRPKGRREERPPGRVVRDRRGGLDPASYRVERFSDVVISTTWGDPRAR